MPRSKIIDVNKIKKDLDKAIQKVGKEVGEEIKQSYLSSMDYFYGDYDPKIYERTEASLLASSGENGIPVYKKTGEMSCEAGITVDPGFMGEPYSKSHGWKNPSASFIFGRTWLSGIHGFTEDEAPGGFAPPVSSPPANRMDDYFNEIQQSIGGKISAIFSI